MPRRALGRGTRALEDAVGSSPYARRVEPSPFEWGWDALVAIGTLALAAATVLLAWSTRRLAAATAQDVAAQWRPAITPGKSVEVTFDHAAREVYLSLRNVGAGAAYFVDIGLDLGSKVFPAAPWEPNGTEPSNFAVVPPGEMLQVHFLGVHERPPACTVLVDYEDVAAAKYSTRIEVTDLPHWYPDARASDALRMSRVVLSAGGELIPWKRPPSLWWRAKRALRERRRRNATSTAE